MSARDAAHSTDAIVGGAILHPLSLSAMGLLLLNDHVLKGRFPGVITGKLSDVAGMVFFPLLLLGLWQLGRRAAGKDWQSTAKSALYCALATALVFAATKVSDAAGSAYAYSLGALQWPFRVLLAALQGGRAAFGPVAHTVDPTDLLAVPFVFMAYVIARPRAAPAELVAQKISAS